MHQTLYRKYRPRTFDDVCGQDHITSVLKYELEHGKTTHAYLFCGSRGTGKTTCAKILARALNCLSPVNGNPCGECEACRALDGDLTTDVLEMDAASNTGVEYIRDIRDAVMYPPTMLKNRVYIIDEVHMLSISAFNALLKTLEEPPERVVFILATTESQKIPATILSRCQRFDFARISVPVIADRLDMISKNEGFEVEKDALVYIARLAQGGMRDAVSMLELCAAAGGKITRKTVEAAAGTGDRASLYTIARAVSTSDTETIFTTVSTLYYSSVDPSVYITGLMTLWRDMLITLTVKNPAEYIESSPDELDELRGAAEAYSQETIIRHLDIMDMCLSEMQRSPAQKRILLETALLRMASPRLEESTAALLQRISVLEDKLAALSNGIPISTPFAPAKKALDESDRAKTENKVPTPDSSKKAPVQQESGVEAASASLKAIGTWADIADRMLSVSPILASCLLKCRALWDETKKKVIIRCDGDFVKDYIEDPKYREALCTAISSSNAKYSGCTIETEVTDNTSADDEFSDF